MRKRELGEENDPSALVFASKIKRERMNEFILLFVQLAKEKKYKITNN